jgi:NAD-specific glutamate dehydrogenase
VESWLAGAGAAADGVRRAVQEMRTTGAADFPTLSVALQAVRRLAER